MTIVILVVISTVCILSRDEVNPILLSMLLTYSLSIQSCITNMLGNQMFIETQMVNAERCMLMTQIVQEKHVEPGTLLEERVAWPENGFIQFQNVSLKYRPDTELVLKNLTFDI